MQPRQAALSYEQYSPHQADSTGQQGVLAQLGTSWSMLQSQPAAQKGQHHLQHLAAAAAAGMFSGQQWLRIKTFSRPRPFCADESNRH
jgi:hypothetical protein